MRNLIAIICLGLLVLAPASVGADPANICESLAALKRVHNRSGRGQSVASPAEVAALMLRIEQAFSEHLKANPSSELVRIGHNLSAVAAGLQPPENGRPAVSGHALYWSLTVILADLTAVQAIFDCQPAATPSQTVEKPSPGPSRNTLRNGLLNSFGPLAPKLTHTLVLFILFAGAISALFLVKRRQRDIRRICNIHLHIVYGEECTITRIFDLSQSGMKIEAAAKDAGKTWLEFHFGGHKVEGKIVWRSTLYAGVKFRKRLDKETLEKILATSNKPIAESGIEKTSTACFHEGCHLDCPHHVPTALSLKASLNAGKR